MKPNIAGEGPSLGDIDIGEDSAVLDEFLKSDDEAHPGKRPGKRTKRRDFVLVGENCGLKSGWIMTCGPMSWMRVTSISRRFLSIPNNLIFPEYTTIYLQIAHP